MVTDYDRLAARIVELQAQLDRLERVRENARLWGEANLERVRSELERELPDHKLQIAATRGGIEIVIPAETLFRAGESAVIPSGHKVLRALAEAMAGLSRHDVQVSGHMDSPHGLSGPLDRRALQLSMERAGAVMLVFLDAGISRSSLSAQGYGATRPLVANFSRASRAWNRRVEILVAPAEDRAPPVAVSGHAK
jgi:flagellar motor protein MotB